MHALRRVDGERTFHYNTAMSAIQLFFLGPAQMRREGHPPGLRAAKAVALLAYLAVTGTSQRREHLVDLLWPESLPSAARKNLRNTLWTIRKALGEGVLSYPDAEAVTLSDAIWVDVHTFETAAEDPAGVGLGDAIELYRAPLLEGFALPDAADFEVWLSTERERLGLLYLRCLERLIAIHRAEADWQGVVGLARRVLVADDLQEPVYRALMEAHARLGERAEALRQYERLRATLARELGVDPLPETEAMRTAILAGGLPVVGPAARDVPSSPRPAKGARRQPFVGRQAELDALEEEWQLAGIGHLRVALITGELGIGKSRLWREWSRALPPGSVVLETKCLDTTRSLPFAPLTSLFGSQVCLESIARPDSPVSPIWLAELARLMPEIRRLQPEIPPPATLPPDEERHRLFEAFLHVLRALEGQPLVLFVDDLHWADRATLDWLLYLVDRLQQAAVMLVGAYRPQDAPVQLLDLVAGWNREGIVRQLPLARLSVDEARQLIAAVGGDAASVTQLQAASAGNPYFLLELSQAPSGQRPSALSELLRVRLNRLPDVARQVLQAAAILDGTFGFPALRRTSGRGEEETLDALDILLARGVLSEQETQYQFVHPLVAMVVREDLSAARRRFLHQRAAEVLESIHAGNLAPIAGQLVLHHTQAGSPSRAAQYAELAAERALELTALEEAADFFREALVLDPSPDRRLALGRALSQKGDLEGAREVLGVALEEFRVEHNGAGAASAALALAGSYLPSGEGQKVIRWAERALSWLDEASDPESLSNAHYLLAAGGMQTGCPLGEAEARLLTAAELAAENDLSEMASRSEFELGNLLAQRGDLEDALRAYDRAISLARDAQVPFLEVLGHNNLAYHALLAGDRTTAWEQIQVGLRLADDLSLFLPRQYLYSTRGEIALNEGHLEEAEEWFNRALHEAHKHHNQAQAANIQANLALVARERGDLDTALALLESAHDLVDGLVALHLQIQLDLWSAELYLQRGEHKAAEEALEEAEGRLAGSDRRHLAAWASRVRAAWLQAR